MTIRRPDALTRRAFCGAAIQLSAAGMLAAGNPSAADAATKRRPMNIQRFVKARAGKAHNDTILASAWIPKGMKAPFDAAWGYLENGHEMEAHAHPTAEIYCVFKGTGKCRVGDEWADVGPGDVIEIPPDATHTMKCEQGGPFLWAALWWKVA